MVKTKKNSKKDAKNGPVPPLDDLSATSASTRTSNTTATKLLDERIADQRKGYNGAAGEAADRQAKERARSTAGTTMGVKREPTTKHDTGVATTSNTASGNGDEDAAAVAAATSPRKPTRSDSKLLGNTCVRSAVNDLEQKEVLRTKPSKSPKADKKSPKADKKSPKSSQSKENAPNKLRKTDQDDIAAKRNAKAPPPGSATKRSPPVSLMTNGTANTTTASTPSSSSSSNRLNQMEADMEAKARAKASSTGTAPTSVKKRLNQMEADMEAKARAKGSPAKVTSKRLKQMESDMEAKSKAKGSPAKATSKRLEQMESDMEAKSKAKGSPAKASTKRLNQMEADMAAKTQARASRNSVTTVAAMSDSEVTSRPGAVSVTQLDERVAAKTGISLGNEQQDKAGKQATRPGAVSSMSSDLEERIAYKTGIPLSEQDRPEEAQYISKSTKGKGRSGAVPKDKDIVLEPERARGSTRNDRVALQSLHQGSTPAVDYHFGIDGFKDEDDGENEDGHLAVAVAVKDFEDEDVFIPAAVEYDPDAKPPMYKNRRFRMYGLLSCTLLIMLVACAMGLMAFQQEQEQKAAAQNVPSGPPTCERCSMGIEEQLELEVGSEKLNDPSTSEYLAKEWIIHEDPMQLQPVDTNLVQRFLLAAFYFETHKLGDWRSCNRQSEENPDETCLLLTLIGIFPMEFEGVPATRWLSSKHECLWAGINCDELNNTRTINLHGQAMKGTFPEVVTHLPYVQNLAFAYNDLEGPLPDSIASLRHLLNVEFQWNQFTGNLPLSWSNSKNLQLLNFAGNFLSGQLPSEIGLLRNTKGLFLQENILSGRLPDEIAEVSLLTYARFHRNFFTGTVPSTFGEMNLNELWLYRNPFTGTIPSELGKLSNHLIDLRLYGTDLTGTVPDEIWELTNLWRLDLHMGSFRGTISSDIENLESLNVFRISDNRFSGTLPTQLALLSSLNTLWLDGNDFVGSVPSGLCDNKGPDGIEFIQADCLPSPSGVVAVTCECCDSCCSIETDECVTNSSE